MLVLTAIQGPDKGRRFELPDYEPQMIGRSSESLPLTDQTISRRHAELTPDDGKWFIRDLNSSNGTFVNGVRVRNRRELRPGDQIRTGMTLLVYGQDMIRSEAATSLRMAEKGEIGVNVEHTVASNDDSMIMAVPEPSQAAVFQLKVIYELTALIGSVTDQQDLLERVMNLIFEYFQADRGFILLADHPDAEPTPVVVRHRANPDKAGSTDSIAISKTIVRYVTRKNVGVLSSNAMNDERFATGDSVQNLGIRSAMCVPIKFKDRLYGVIQLDSQIANYTYTEDQLTLLTAIGVQTGLALANLNHYAARLKAERLAAVGQTVASLSHSIKNILQGLRGGADVVELGLRKANMNLVKNGWEIVARNLERIYELTMNMLAFSKQRKPELEMVNLEAVLTEAMTLVQKQYENKKVALISDMAPDMPPVPADPSGVHQAVLNLLNNALDAVEPDSGVVSVRGEYDEEHEQVRLVVSDNGEGMSQGTVSRLFEPFHSTKGMRGTGLGLVVIKKIVEEHGGTVTVDTQLGQGTTFTLTLPANPERIPASADTHGPS
ncbi:ATP-binding protein [Phycisphaerales bacterium AB-hyl4]|uniref:histidine kinase n=1 Tax=Natronomicrosphaera hydrolytica TaxID=3242702 RepID=A0ABV4U4U6_9BACT